MKRFFQRRASDDKSTQSSASSASVETPRRASTSAPQKPRPRTLSKGLTRDAFRRSLEDPKFLHKFANWLSSKCSAELLLFWIAAEHHRQELVRVRALAEKLEVDSMSFIKSMVGSEEASAIESRYSALQATQDPFAEARENAFEQLFSDYPQFLQDRIQKLQTKEQNESGETAQGRYATEAASWVVAAPERDSRQCVMMASERLSVLTGYASLCGHPWTVLQGQHDDEASRRIRTACEKGLPGQELLLSFKADGTPFQHLLRSVPLVGKRKTLDGFLFLSWDVTSLVSTNGLDDLLSDELDDPSGEDSSFYDAELQEITNEAVRARLKRQEARHLPRSISEAALSPDMPIKSTTVEVLRQTALRPPTSGSGQITPTAELPEEVAARHNAIADEAVAPFLILDVKGEHVTHADPALEPYWVSGISFAATAERTTVGIASRVRQAARQGRPVVMSASFNLPGGQRETQFSLTPLLDGSGRPAALCLSFWRQNKLGQEQKV